MMKVFAKSTLLVALIFMAVVGQAQKNDKSGGWRMGVGFVPGVATNGGYGFALGADVRLQTEIAPKMHFILTTGVTGFFKKNNVKGMSYIPVKPGIKYFLGDNFYAGGEVGLGFGMVKNSGRSFIWAPILGLSFKNLDLGIKYEDASDFKFAADGTNNNYCKQFGLRIAYGFTLQ